MSRTGQTASGFGRLRMYINSRAAHNIVSAAVLGLILFGVVKLFYDVATGPRRSIALAKSWELADGRTLAEGLRAVYGWGEWESTPNKRGFIVSYNVNNVPQYGEGRTPTFWVELNPRHVGTWMGADHDICEQVGIRFR